jgi:peptide/nickel transport system substrate-binding protein
MMGLHKNRDRGVTGVAFLAAALIAATACGGGPTSSGPRQGGTLKVAINEDVPTIDPHKTVAGSSEGFFAAVAPSLLQFDKNLSYVPALAETWQVSSDLLTYTFHLRPGVKFSNGRAVTSADVKYNYERILKPDTGSLLASVLPISSIATPDVSTAVFTMKTANVDELYYLVWPGRSAIIAPESVNEKNVVGMPIGTGPFKIKDYKQGVSLTLVRNPLYWAKGPVLDTVQFNVLIDPTARGAALTAGDVDVALQVSETKGFVTQQVFDNTASQWSLNTRRPATGSAMVRQAMQMAISRADIINAGYNGAATAADSIFTVRSPWHIDRAFPLNADTAKATQLVKDSGVDLSKYTVTLKYLVPGQLQEIQLVAAAWKKLGFKDVVLKVMQSANVVAEISGGDWDAIVFQPSSVNVPDRQYTYYDPTSGWRYGLSGYLNSPRVIQLLQTAKLTSDVATRKNSYAEIDNIGNVLQSSMFFTIQPKLFNGLRSNVKGWNQSENATLWTYWVGGGIMTAYLS